MNIIGYVLGFCCYCVLFCMGWIARHDDPPIVGWMFMVWGGFGAITGIVLAGCWLYEQWQAFTYRRWLARR